ncbi:unnamed protein product, partial [marine sediment metagenome]
NIPVDMLLSKEHAGHCREKIDSNKAMLPSIPSSYAGDSDTVYVTAVDENSNAVSFISSIYLPFGSGMVVDGTGIVLQNRGKSFSLDPNHFNKIEPHKRPMHTIIPGMVFKDGNFLMSFGVMGGDMQPQGHVQFLINLIDFKMNLQEAVDAPRIRHMGGNGSLSRRWNAERDRIRPPEKRPPYPSINASGQPSRWGSGDLLG